MKVYILSKLCGVTGAFLSICAANQHDWTSKRGDRVISSSISTAVGAKAGGIFGGRWIILHEEFC